MPGHRGHRTNVPHYVYRCYDADGRLLYIGCSNSPKYRIHGHTTGRYWWPEVARVRYTVFPDRKKGLEIERAAIWEERPKYNVKGRWQFWDDREDWKPEDYVEYHQVVLRSGRDGQFNQRLLGRIEIEAGSRFGIVLMRKRATA